MRTRMQYCTVFPVARVTLVAQLVKHDDAHGNVFSVKRAAGYDLWTLLVVL
jgi:hypothetical protein